MADLHKKALAMIRHDNWEACHDLVQDNTDEMSCLIHGYLHRIEGDEFNARYWYNLAGHSMPSNSQEEELKRLEQLVSTRA